MNKDIITNIYRVFVLALLVWIVLLLDAITHYVDYKNLSDAINTSRVQDVRIVKQANEPATSSIQDVRIVNSLIPVSGEVSIRETTLGLGIPVRITGEPISVKVETKDGFSDKPILVRVER